MKNLGSNFAAAEAKERRRRNIQSSRSDVRSSGFQIPQKEEPFGSHIIEESVSYDKSAIEFLSELYEPEEKGII